MQQQAQAEAAIASLQEIQQPATAQAETVWPIAQRVCFRFAFSYLVLYTFPSPLTVLPWVDKLFGWYDTFWQNLVIFTGAHVLHLAQPVQYQPTGSGDTLHDYIQNLLILVFAVVAAIIWSVLDRRRQNYRYFHEWLRFWVRLYLGATLIGYGAFKVIKAQFPYPYLSRLLEPYGESSPMGLLWTFMGYSRLYNIFTGMVEMLGGALVIVPRLATLGALISAAAMTNVFLLNMSYDVPVKLFSFNLLLMTCFILLPDLKRLTNIFVLNRENEPVVAPPLFQRRSLVAGLLATQLLFLSWSCFSSLRQSYKQATQYGDFAPRPARYGVYNVEEFTVDGQVRAPLFTDAGRWRRVTFDLYNAVIVVPPEGPVLRYRGNFDDNNKTVELMKPTDPKWKATLAIDTPSPGVITLSGEMDGKKITAKLRKIELNSFLLNNRGFHWISEFPFNR